MSLPKVVPKKQQIKIKNKLFPLNAFPQNFKVHVFAKLKRPQILRQVYWYQSRTNLIWKRRLITAHKPTQTLWIWLHNKNSDFYKTNKKKILNSPEQSFKNTKTSSKYPIWDRISHAVLLFSLAENSSRASKMKRRRTSSRRKSLSHPGAFLEPTGTQLA